MFSYVPKSKQSLILEITYGMLDIRRGQGGKTQNFNLKFLILSIKNYEPYNAGILVQ